MIPLTEEYDVCQINNGELRDAFIVAHAKSENKLPNREIKIAGIVKELKDKDQSDEGKFLEALYYICD